jgi:hypothetical protein
MRTCAQLTSPQAIVSAIVGLELDLANSVRWSN